MTLATEAGGGGEQGVNWRTILQQDAEVEIVQSLTKNSRREAHSLKTPSTFSKHT
jgi:hypothetical protein